MDCRGTGVLSHDVLFVWPAVEQHLRKAIELGPVTADELLEDLLKRNRQLWIVLNDSKIIGAAVTMLNEREDGKYCELSFLGGQDFKFWNHLEDVLEAWAKHHNCTVMECYARKGLRRYLTKNNFRFVKTTEIGDYHIKEL